MEALHLKKKASHSRKRGGFGSPGPVGLACGAVATLALSGAALAPSGSNAAQAAPAARTLAPGDVWIRSSVAGATPWAQPGPNTPVPKWAQDSYKVFLDMKAKARPAPADANRMPDWSGLWTLEPGHGYIWDNGIEREARGLGPKPAKLILDHCWQGDKASFPCKGYLLADLTPEYALRLRQKLVAVTNDVEWDPLSDCQPPGFPRGALLNPFGRELIVTPKETWMTSQTLNDIRRIYTDGRGHTPENEAAPLWDGESIGFWDGDTLVVHTMYVRAHVEMQRLQPDLSDQASFIERIRMTGPDTIEDEATIYDPVALKTPWHTVIKFVRMSDPHNHVNMYSCDPNVYQTPEGATDIIIPGQTVTIEREYRDPEDAGYAVDKVLEYGAKVLRGENPPKPKQSGQ
jgi:hypothetical protein